MYFILEQKHVEIKYYFIEEKVDKGFINLQYIHSSK
jgi:hypothetical protein